ncbi:hypothetical protein I3843_07G009400 [Carya illinoinensis]|nr:hypothetical protein I3843_07G009400 [Carya illinoinensis]
MYKNQLQELAQRSCFNLPSYSCIREGPDHAPRFKATVNFNGDTFESPTFCSTLRQAEHAAAEVALNTLANRGPSRALAARVLDETGVYKNLLQETAHRAGLKLPVYTTVRSGPGHVPTFSCTVELAGMSFTGEPARTKKQAQKNAAMAAWSALRKLSQSHSSSRTSPSLESNANEEQEQVTIARVLASLQPSESNRPAENYQGHVHQRSTPILWESTQQTPSLYHMQCQNWAYFPEMAMYQIWQQEQLLQQQSRLLALTVPAATTSVPQIYPLMQSFFQPDQCLYFPGREPESIQMRPRITIAASSPPFCFSNHLVPSSIRGRSTVTIQEIQEEKLEESSKYSSSGVSKPPSFSNNNNAEPQILEIVQEDDKQNLNGIDGKIRSLQLEGNQRGQFERASHRSIDSIFKPVELQLRNPCIDSSRPNLRPQYPPRASSHRNFRPISSAAAPIKIRTMHPTASMEVRPQNMASLGAAPPRMRTAGPSCSTRPSERFNLGGVSPAFMAPAVRIRSVVPVCSAPPLRKMPNSGNDAVSPNTERKI